MSILNDTYGTDKNSGASVVETAEHAVINNVAGKKVFNIDSVGNIIDGYQSSKITTVGSITYVGVAPCGTAQSAALWQCKKVDSSVLGTTVITWADGNANFDNIATDLTSLSYS